MARITKSGTGGAVKISVDNSTYETIAEIRSWACDETVDTVEDTNMGSSGVRSYKTTHKTWTGSADVYIAYNDGTADTETEQLTEEDNVEALSTIAVGTTYYFKFYADDSVATPESYNGTGIVTGVSRSVAHDGLAEMSITIQGTSLLT